MSSKRQKIEAEILRYRNDNNWSKMEEQTKVLSRKYGAADGAVMMLESEVTLERYLLENPPRQQNVPKSRKDLSQLKVKLQDCVATECKDSLFNVKEDSRILLCRLLYAQGNAKQCLEIIKNLTLENSTNDLQCYKIKLIAEIYAIKALCLEHLNLKGAQEEDSVIIADYEHSADLSFEYIAEYERQGGTGDPHICYGMEMAFQRGPLLHMKNGNIEAAIFKLRNTVQSKITPAIKQTLAKDLATVLLRGVCDTTYRSPSSSMNHEEPEGSKSTKIVLRHGSNSPTATFTISPVDKTLSPTDLTQESVLLLIVSEAILNTDPILDMSPEYAEARQELLKDSKNLYDLLAIALSDFAQYDVFTKSIEASLKYSYNEFHIWFQYGLSLICSGKLDRAIRVLMECSRIEPKNPAPTLLAAKICYENLNQVSVGLEFAKKALNAASGHDGMSDSDENEDYLCSAHLAVGIGHSMQCLDGTPIEKVKEQRSKAILHFSEAHNVDPSDAKPLLFLAVEMALDRRINEAIAHVKEALKMQPQDLNCIHLFTLLLSAQNRCKEAFTVLEMGVKFYPENMNLLVTKCKLELHVGRNEDALRTCNHMTQMFKTLHEDCMSRAMNTDAIIDRMTSDGLSVTNQSVGNELDLMDGGSFIGSVAMSRLERAMSDIESSLGDINPRGVNVPSASPSLLHAHIWLLTAEVYLSLRRLDEAGQCVQEASALYPLSHAVLYARGRLAQCRGDLNDAATMYKNTVSINPKHHKAMLEWAKILIQQRKYEFAKKLLQDAAKLNPMSHEIWLQLGEVFQGLGDTEGTVECMTMAINIEATAPVVPFITIPRDL